MVRGRREDGKIWGSSKKTVAPFKAVAPPKAVVPPKAVAPPRAIEPHGTAVSQKTAKRSALLQRELAQSASQNHPTRPWHNQITIHERDQTSNKPGKTGRQLPLPMARSPRAFSHHGGDQDPSAPGGDCRVNATATTEETKT